MTLYYGLIVLGLACLFAPFSAKLAGYEIAHRKPFDLVGIGGILFMLSASFQLAVSIIASVATLCNILMIVSFVIGWIGLLCGVLWAAAEVLGESDHGLHGARAGTT